MLRKLVAVLAVCFVPAAAGAAEGLSLIDLRKAAAEGEVEAQTDLGSHYLLGEGVPRDPEIARTWFVKAAGKGHPLAQTILGWLYMGGAGIKADHARAALWLQKAAMQDIPEAQLSLGTLYARGQGVSQNLVDAHVWLTLASERLKDEEKVTEATDWRDTVAQYMSPEQIEEATGLALQMGVVFGRN